MRCTRLSTSAPSLMWARRGIPRMSPASSCPVGSTSHSLSTGLVRFGLFHPCCVLEIVFSSASLYVSNRRSGVFTINLLREGLSQSVETARWTLRYAVTQLSTNWSRRVRSAYFPGVALSSHLVLPPTLGQTLGFLVILAKIIPQVPSVVSRPCISTSDG